MRAGTFTPGPWLVDHRKGSLSYVKAATGEPIASCSWKHGQEDVPAIANARLIATAPRLLSAGEAVLANWERGDLAAAVRELADAIAEAKGLAA
jgi:hypothetical protein